MREDGTYQIYMIQHQLGSGGWRFSNLDHFEFPAGFNASDECWQKTGVHGTMREKEARAALRWIRRKHKKTIFRLVLRITVQLTTPVSEPKEKPNA